MPRKFDLMHDAQNLAEAAKDAMRSEISGPPDDTTWGIALSVLIEAKKMLPSHPIVQGIELKSKLWVSIRTAMEAVANGLSAEGHADVVASAAAANKRRLRGI